MEFVVILSETIRESNVMTNEIGKPHGMVIDTMEAWHRGENCHFLPDLENLSEPNALEKYVLFGWLPDKPFIQKHHKITAFGSCFASYIMDYLKKHRYVESNPNDNSYVVRFNDEIVNTFAVAQQFEWAWEDREFSEKLWYTRKKDILTYDDGVKKATRDLFNQTDLFIITIGLSEVWYNKETGEVFWKAIVKKHFDPNKHGFKLTTYQENVDNLKIVVNLIKKHRPSASIVFTLSPIPLVATFRPVSCITANSVSKSILRSALDEVVCHYGKENNVYYWPGYEIIKDFEPTPFGTKDPIHPRLEVIDYIMEAFSKYYVIRE